jgi:hypothetical protein
VSSDYFKGFGRKNFFLFFANVLVILYFLAILWWYSGTSTWRHHSAGKNLFVKKKFVRTVFFRLSWLLNESVLAILAKLSYPMQWLEVLFTMLWHCKQRMYEYTGWLQILRPNQWNLRGGGWTRVLVILCTWGPVTCTVIRFVCVRAKFSLCIVVSVNWILVEDKMRRIKGECAHFSFNKCPISTHDGASDKCSTNAHETDNSVRLTLGRAFLCSLISSVYHDTDGWMLLVRRKLPRDREKSSGQANILNICAIWAMDRTSAQP